MSEVATKAQAAKDAVQAVFDKRQAGITRRVAQLRRIKTPGEDATEDAAASAAAGAQSFITSITG
jgi:hypothetical protein